MKYKINYFCQNCETTTEQEFKKGTKAPITISCSNCGCTSTKNGIPAPTEPLPEPKKWPYGDNPWDEIEPWTKPSKPWKSPPIYPRRNEGPIWMYDPHDKSHPIVTLNSNPITSLKS